MRGATLLGIGLLLGCNDGQMIGWTEPESSPDQSLTIPEPDQPLGLDQIQMAHESFTATASTGNVDILWVVDDSPSMDNEQAAIATNFNSFINNFYDLNLDFHIAVTTTSVRCSSCENGKFVGTPSVMTSALSKPDLAAAFTAAVRVGSSGSSDEEGLHAAELALSPELLGTTNAGFLRDNALLAILFVSDENDHSAVKTPAEFVTLFQNVKGGQSDKLLLGGITAPRDTTCAGAAERGLRYVDAINLVGGPWEEICSSDFSGVLTRIGQSVTDTVPRLFKLKNLPRAGSIQVELDGVALQSGALTWTYLVDENAISFATAAAVKPSSVVDVWYAPVL